MRCCFKEELKEELKKIIFDKNYENYSNLDSYREMLQSNINKIPNLFRYVEADYNSIRNIEVNKIKLRQGSEFNDIFESMPTFEVGDRRNLIIDAVYYKI